MESFLDRSQVFSGKPRSLHTAEARLGYGVTAYYGVDPGEIRGRIARKNKYTSVRFRNYLYVFVLRFLWLSHYFVMNPEGACTLREEVGLRSESRRVVLTPE